MSPMIMKVAVPLPKHSPMFGQRRFLAHRVQAVLAQDLLDLVEARGWRPALTRIQSGFFSRSAGTILIVTLRMRARSSLRLFAW